MHRIYKDMFACSHLPYANTIVYTCLRECAVDNCTYVCVQVRIPACVHHGIHHLAYVYQNCELKDVQIEERTKYT